MCASMQNNVKSFLEDDPKVAKCCCLDDDPNMKVETGANDQDMTGDNPAILPCCRLRNAKRSQLVDISSNYTLVC